MSWMIYDHLTMWPLDHIHMTVWPGDWSDEWTKYTARQGDMKWKKILKDSGWCDKNGLNESFKMSPHLICLNWGINFHITSRPDPEAGHKRDLRPQLRHIKWGLILKLSMRLFSWHLPKSLRIFFHFESLSRSVDTNKSYRSSKRKDGLGWGINRHGWKFLVSEDFSWKGWFSVIRQFHSSFLVSNFVQSSVWRSVHE